jgi:hypothetical protein
MNHITCGMASSIAPAHTNGLADPRTVAPDNRCM